MRPRWTRGKGIPAKGAPGVVRYEQGRACGKNCKKYGLHMEAGCGQAGDEAAELGRVQIVPGLVLRARENISQPGQEGYGNGQRER